MDVSGGLQPQFGSLPRSEQEARRLMFVPEDFRREATGNAYTERMVESWRLAGFRPIPEPKGWRQRWAALQLRRQTVGVINWADSLLIDQQGRLSPKGLVRFVYFMLKMRLVCSTLIFVRHNIFPHAAKGNAGARAARILDLCEAVLFHRVVVHSTHLTNRWRSYVAHPSYSVESDPMSATPGRDIVFFGAISPYKRLEQLIDAWPNNARLVVAGGGNPKYVEDLQRRAVGRPISFVTSGLSDAAAQKLLSTAAAAIVPHAGPDMIVSGAMYFALSCGVPVVCCGLAHAKALAGEGMPGVVNLEAIEQLAALDVEVLRAMDRAAIRAAAEQRFGPPRVAAQLRELVRSRPI